MGVLVPILASGTAEEGVFGLLTGRQRIRPVQSQSPKSETQYEPCVLTAGRHAAMRLSISLRRRADANLRQI